eukprot:8620973-Pyramimonas_sp.AAC.1
MDGAGRHRDLAGQRPWRRVLRWRAKQQKPLDIAGLDVGRHGVIRRNAPTRLRGRGEGKVKCISRSCCASARICDLSSWHPRTTRRAFMTLGTLL